MSEFCHSMRNAYPRTLLDKPDLRMCVSVSAHNPVSAHISFSQHLIHLLLSCQRESTTTCLCGTSMRRMSLVSLWPASTALSPIACWRLLTLTKPCGTTWRQNIHPFSYPMKILWRWECCQPSSQLSTSSLPVNRNLNSRFNWYHTWQTKFYQVIFS